MKDASPGVDVREATEVLLLRTGKEGMYMLLGWLLSDDVSVKKEKPDEVPLDMDVAALDTMDALDEDDIDGS